MANKEKPLKILSIKPGTKYMAIAVLDNQDLVYWRNKKIRHMKISDSQTIKRLKDVLSKLINFWKPEVIAVEDIFYVQSRKNSLLNVLVQEIKNIGKERKIKIYLYSPVLVRKFICKKERINKMNTAKLLVNRYPWLYKKYEKENKKRWYQFKFGLRIFDAIAVGLFCFHQLQYAQKGKNH
jgi:Holliday junction resolvasome RuvABC endonuclease subunit